MLRRLRHGRSKRKRYSDRISVYDGLLVFQKKYYVPEDRDEYWAELVSAADELYNKYPSPYFEKMILNCAEDIDKRYKKQIREKQNE